MLYLLRHSLTDFNTNDITQVNDDRSTLNAEGIELIKKNAESIQAQLCEQPILLVSPLRRAKDTAMYISKPGYRVITVSELVEVDFGVYAGQMPDFNYQGRTMEDYRKLAMQDMPFQFPNGDTHISIKARCAIAWDRVATFHKLSPKSDIVLVGHNRMFRHMIAWQTGQYKRMFDKKFPHASLVQVDTSNFKHNSFNF